MNFLGWYSGAPETISSWCVADNSAQLDVLRKRGLAQGVTLFQYRLELSGGSTLSALASGVSLEERPDAE